MKKFLTALLLLVAIFPLLKIVWQKRDFYLSPHNPQEAKNAYGISQYMLEEKASWIPDELHFSYASWNYVNGGNPILINPDYPPLGKYLVGFSMKLFDNEKIPTLLFAFLSLLSLFLIGLIFLRESWLALLPIGLFAWGKLFQEQLIYLPLFEVFTLAFLNLAFYYFIKAEEKSEYYVLVGLFIGFVWGTKPWMLTIPLMLAWTAYLGLRRKLKKLVLWLASLFLAVGVLALSYSKLLVDGWSLYKVLSVQKWILWYHQSKLIKFGTVWPFLYLKRWYVWWGDEPYVIVDQWNILWPIFTSLALIFSVLVLLKTMSVKKRWLNKLKFDQRIASLCLWVVFYLGFLSAGNISVRYVFYLLPFCYLLGIYFLVILWRTRS